MNESKNRGMKWTKENSQRLRDSIKVFSSLHPNFPYRGSSKCTFCLNNADFSFISYTKGRTDWKFQEPLKLCKECGKKIQEQLQEVLIP